MSSTHLSMQGEDKVNGQFGPSVMQRHDQTLASADLEMGGDIYDLWQSKIADNILPCWRDFQFRDLAGHHAHIGLSEISFDGKGPKFRIFGSSMAEDHGGDYTGRYFSEFAAGVNLNTYIRHFEQLVRHGWVGISKGFMIAPDQQYASYYCLELPLRGRSPEKMEILHRFQRFASADRRVR